MVRHLKFRSGENIRIASLKFRKFKSSKEIAIRDHLLSCNKILSFHQFIILAYGYHKYVHEIKESLLIKRDRYILNKNISSAKLFILTITRTLIVSIIP